MESLNAYLTLVSPQLLKQVSGKPAQFIHVFQEEIFLTEEAFIRKICGEKHDLNYYRELKSRTKKILQALAIISPSKGDNKVKKKYDFCQRNFLMGQKFLNKGERKEGIRLINQAWQAATDYDFVHLACELSSILYHDHVYYNKNKRKAEFYARKVDQYIHAYSTEKKAEDHFFQAISIMGTTFQPELIKNTTSAIEQLKGTSILLNTNFL